MTNQPKGLSSSEVQSRVKSGQVNKFKDSSQKSLLGIISGVLIDLPNGIIFTAVGFLIAYQQLQDALMISSVMIVNILVSIVQEIQARNSLKRINVVNKSLVTVIRDGKEVEIEPEDIVLDDVIAIKSGMSLFVDGEVIISDNLLIDESVLTGESDYLRKKPTEKLLSGSIIVAGSGYYRARKVGPDSFVNKITAAARKYVNYLSPLQVNINNIVKVLTFATVGVLALLFVLNILYLDIERIELARIVISIVSSTIPQGIILTITVAFMLGVIRMYQKRILVQKANAIETLAAIKVLAMDKTGTLTENKLTVENMVKLTADLKDFFGTKDSPRLETLLQFYTQESMEKNKTLLTIADFLNDKVKGSELEKFTKSVKIIDQLPFTSKLKHSGIEFSLDSLADRRFRVILGSPEILLQDIPQDKAKKIQAEMDKFAEKGMRNVLFLLGVSRKSSTKQDDELRAWVGSGAKNEFDYIPLTFLALEDKLRAGAKAILEEFISQGVKPVVISGDGPKTLTALLKQINVPTMDKVVSGEELAAAHSEIQKGELILGSDIFARVSPEQKVEIISVYQKAYGRVAMVGDGINDALAIKKANLGISMAAGANVSKNIADVVLLDNDLKRLPEVLSEGREIIFNTLRSSQLLLTRNFYSLIVSILTLAVALPYPFSPRSLFLLSLFNGTLPILAALADRNPNLREIDFMKKLREFVIISGTIIAIMSIILLIALAGNNTLLQTQSTMLAFLTFTGVVNSLICLNKSYSIPTILFGSWKTLVGVATIGLLLLSLYMPFLNEFFNVEPVNANNMLLSVVLGIVYLLGMSGVMRLRGASFL